MGFPVIISFYTINTPYELEVQNLIRSCARFGLKTSIDAVDSMGKWELNCAYKPFFILKKMEELGQSVLWVDADGVFLRKPKWQQAFDADLAVRLDPNLPNNHPSKVITSTLFVASTEGAKGLIKEWIKESYSQLLEPNRKEEFWDQIALRDAILKSSAKVNSLPLEYAKIFDHPADLALVHKPVIEHYQASRRFKHFCK